VKGGIVKIYTVKQPSIYIIGNFNRFTSLIWFFLDIFKVKKTPKSNFFYYIELFGTNI